MGMKPTVLLKILGAEALPDAEGAFIEMETSEGPLELRCTYEDAERLIAALQAARAKVQDARVHAAKPPLPEPEKPADRWETAIDPVNQDALIRAVYPDRTTQETRIPRSEVRSIARALEQVAQRFDVSAEMRQ
jgi:hypothetical protein